MANSLDIIQRNLYRYRFVVKEIKENRQMTETNKTQKNLLRVKKTTKKCCHPLLVTKNDPRQDQQYPSPISCD